MGKKHRQMQREATAVAHGRTCVTLLAARLAQLEAEVATGERDARTLVVIPKKLAAAAVLTFPVEAFGPTLGWDET